MLFNPLLQRTFGVMKPTLRTVSAFANIGYGL